MITVKFKENGQSRKVLAQHIAAFLGQKAKYTGVPSCAYVIGDFAVTKSGELTFSEDADKQAVKNLFEALERDGFRTADRTEEENECIRIPRTVLSDKGLENLRNIVQAKESLIRKALGINDLTIKSDENSVIFPWTCENAEPQTVKAVRTFVTKLCVTAEKSQRMSSKEKEVENEKYAFRCFLLRLGFIGNEYKSSRTVLLKNFTGSSSFKSGFRKTERPQKTSA